MLATMELLTFLLKCCVMTEQEGIMQGVHTFAGTDQCQLPEYGPYSYICKSRNRNECQHIQGNYIHKIKSPMSPITLYFNNILPVSLLYKQIFKKKTY